MSAVPYRHGSECPNSALEAVVFITAPERSPEFLRDEYQKFRAQYLAIENLEARQAFLVERKQLVMRIKEAKLVFLDEINFYSHMYPSACRALCHLGRRTSGCSFRRTCSPKIEQTPSVGHVFRGILGVLFCTHEVLAALSIVDKLVALGWGEEIDKIPRRLALTNHKLVKVPQLLTDRSKLHLR